MKSFWVNLSNREKKLIISLIIILTIYLVYNFVVVNAMEGLETVQEAFSQTEEKEQALELEVAKLTSLKEEYGNYSKEELLERLPEVLDVPEAILWIDNLFSDTRLRQANIEFKVVSEETSYLQMSLSFSGTYDGIYNFIKEVEGSQRVVNIQSINISGPGEAMSANIILNFYAQNINNNDL